MDTKLMSGSILQDNCPPKFDKPIIEIKGTCSRTNNVIQLDENILSRHMMLIGGTGSGKTNAFFHIMKGIKKNLTDNDVLIIFDTKKDYLDKFYEGDDLIVSASDSLKDYTVTWNIFKEMLEDGIDGNAVTSNANEIAWEIFGETIAKNNSNPFFPNAARDLFAAILIGLFRKTGGEQECIDRYLNNSFLKKYLNSVNSLTVRKLLENQGDLISVMNYVGDGKNDQGLGVFAELMSVTRRVFEGAFAEKGDFSIRDFVRKRGGRTLFIEYDISKGSTLTPIYKLMMDLALKEALNSNGKGSVYIFCDEFKLLPHLEHIENALNFGRSKGVKIFAGLQSIDQIIENYGEARGRNIIAGFTSLFSFYANDEKTRSFTIGKYGKNYVIERYSIDHKEMRIGNVVEDWDITGLNKGEAIIGLLENPPFKFHFDYYGD